MTALHAHRIIGGMFGLETPSGSELRVGRDLPAFLTGNQVKLATGRGAFRLLCSFLAPKTVWLPSYLCGVVFGAFPANRTNIQFYAVDERLRVAGDDWLKYVVPGDLTVFIDYFGFNLWCEYGAEARRRGAWVVEDACQAMLNDRACGHSHYVIFSPRKFIGVPDGGILMAQGEARLPDLELPSPPAEWWLDAFAASQLRAEFDHHGGGRQWFELFRKSDPFGPLEPVRMSELSTILLAHAIDYTRIAGKRRENYQFLAEQLAEIAMFPDLPLGIVPLGFPIRLKNRDQVQKTLFRNEIYPPVHWPIEGIVPAEFEASHHLAGEIMTLPCDQRYDETDISRMITALKDAL